MVYIKIIVLMKCITKHLNRKVKMMHIMASHYACRDAHLMVKLYCYRCSFILSVQFYPSESRFPQHRELTDGNIPHIIIAKTMYYNVSVIYQIQK